MQIGEELKVLDSGYVRYVDSVGNDLSIVRAARVSHDAEWRTGEDAGKDSKLIRYLMANRHSSPFEHVAITFEVKCPIFVARQWHRHRTWKYNEVSARYTELPEDYYIPEPEQITQQDSKNHQSRTATPLGDGAADYVRTVMVNNAREAFACYHDLLKRGCPRELARSVLPFGTYTRFFATVDLHNLFHFLRLRLDGHAQYEIRVYAEAMLKIADHVAPVATKAFIETL